MHAAKASSSYVVKVGKEADHRLKILRNIFQESTMLFYKRLGLGEGKKVLDVGCGTGHVAIDIAKEVGPKGSVTAVDISEEQLKVAKKNAAEANCENIEFAQSGAAKLADKYAGQFDFVVCRFLLMHVDNPVLAMMAMNSCLKPGGVLAIEEPEMSKCSVNVKSKHFKAAMDLHLTYANKVGLDFDIGAKLSGMAQSAVLSSPEETMTQPIVSTGMVEKSIYVLLHEECCPKYREKGLASEKELNEISEGLKRLTADPSSIFKCALVHQLAARRRVVESGANFEVKI